MSIFRIEAKEQKIAFYQHRIKHYDQILDTSCSGKLNHEYEMFLRNELERYPRTQNITFQAFLDHFHAMRKNAVFELEMLVHVKGIDF